MQPTQDIYLIATSGFPNFGDELIARAWLRFLHEHYPNHRVWLDCPNPGRASVLFQDTHPNFHVTDTLWRISWSVDPALGVDEKIARVRELIRNLGTPREDLGLLMFPHVSLIHFLGGGYLNTIWGSNLLTLVAATELKNKHPHISLIGSGLGLLPMEDGWRERVSILLKEFDFVEARDHQSADELSVPLGLDDAFLALAQGGIYSRSEQLPDAMLLLQGDFSISTERDEFLRFATSLLMAEGFTGDERLGIVEAIPPDDAWPLAEIHDVWRGPIDFFPFARLWQEGVPARHGQFWVTSRFHFHLLAAARGANGVAINIRPGYYDIKHRSLIDLGTGWEYVSLDDSEQNEAAGFSSKRGAFSEALPSFAQRKMHNAISMYSSVLDSSE